MPKLSKYINDFHKLITDGRTYLDEEVINIFSLMNLAENERVNSPHKYRIVGIDVDRIWIIYYSGCL